MPNRVVSVTAVSLSAAFLWAVLIVSSMTALRFTEATVGPHESRQSLSTVGDEALLAALTGSFMINGADEASTSPALAAVEKCAPGDTGSGLRPGGAPAYDAASFSSSDASSREAYAGAARFELCNGSDKAARQGDSLDPPVVASAVPEPVTWAMMILSMLAVGAMVRRNRSRIALAA